MNFNQNIVSSFNFEELYEGQVVKVNEDNTCYINVYKFFVTNRNTDDVHEAKMTVKSSNIENLKKSFDITKRNAIVCKPFTLNSTMRKMNEGDSVLVMFLNGDPQRPYYLDAYLPSHSSVNKGDVIFSNNNIEILTEIDKDNPKLIIKIMDTTFEIDKDSKLGNTTVNNVPGKPGDTIIIEGEGSIDGDLLKKYLELNSVKREFDALKSKYAMLMSVCDHYEISVKDKGREDLTNSYDELVAYVEPILSKDDSSADATKLNTLFAVYNDNYNYMLGFFLKIKGGSNNIFNNIELDVTDENLESVIRDMIYIVNTKTDKKFIKDIIEDGIFSVQEKKLLSNEIIMINNEYQVLKSFAPLHFADNLTESLHMQYEESYDILMDYISPMMVEFESDTEIGKDEFFNNFMNYFKARIKLYDEIYNYSITIYDNKKEVLEGYASDNLIVSAEKNDILQFLTIYADEKIPFQGLCEIYNVNMKAYEGAYSIIDTQIGTYSNSLDEQIIDKDEFMKNFSTFVDARNKLLETVIAISSTYVDTLMEGIRIGGTNLLYNSSFLYEFNEWTFPEIEPTHIKQIVFDDTFEKILYTDAPIIHGTLTPTFFKAKKDDYVVLNLYMRSYEPSKVRISIIDSGGDNISIPYIIESGNGYEFKKSIVPITIIKDVVVSLDKKPKLKIENILGNTIEIAQLKPEFGTNPSEWSPAPEDRKYEEENFKNIIHEFSSSIIQTTDQIKLSVDAFYSKVTENLEEFRKQNATINIELGNIDLGLTDFYQKSEKIIENLGGMEVVTDTLTTHDKLSKLKLDLDGMHLSVRDVLSKVTNITGTLDGLLAEGGRIDIISGNMLDYNNDLKGMGGVLKKVEGKMETYTTYIDGVKASISKIEEIDQATLTMKGSLNKIEQSLGHITGSNILDLEFDESGNIVCSKYVDKMNEQYTGIVTTIGKVETIAKNSQEYIESVKEVIGDITEENSKMSILDQISKLTVENDNITSQVGKLVADINNFEKLLPIEAINNFSWSHTLNNWYPVGNPSTDENGDILFENVQNVLTLEKYTRDWYFGVISGRAVPKEEDYGIVTLRTEPFTINPSKMYKFSLYLKDHPLNTEGKWRIGARFHSGSNKALPGYVNNSNKLTDELWFDQSGSNLSTIFRNYTGYVYPFEDKYKDGNLLIKGTSDNCLRFNEDAVKMSLIIEYKWERGDSKESLPKLYIDNPEMFEVISMQTEQLKLLQKALIAVEPDNILMAVKNHKGYQSDLESIYKYTDAKIEITESTINQVIQDTTMYDKNGNPIKINEALNMTNSNLDGTTNIVAKINRDMEAMRGNLNLVSGLTIMGNNIFRLSSDGESITPSNLTLYGHIKDLLGVIDETDSIELNWYIDGVYSSTGRSLTLSSSLLKDVNSIKISASDNDETLYDEVTIIKLEEGKDAVNMILSNEYIGLPSSHDGTVMDYSKAYTDIDIYEGVHSNTNKWVIKVENDSSETGIEGQFTDNNRFKITKASKDNASIKFIATKLIDDNEVEVTKSLQISKIKRGESGLQGNSAYSMILSNESQSIPVKSDLTVFDEVYYSTDVVIYQGVEYLDNYSISVDANQIKNYMQLEIYENSFPKTVRIKTVKDIPFDILSDKITITAKFKDPVTEVDVKITKDFTWTCSVQGESARTVDLVADSTVLKSDDGGITYSPDSVQINAIYKDCKFRNWYVSSGKKVEFVKFDSSIHTGIIMSPETFIISKDSSLFNDDITSISVKVTTDISDMYDTITISKLFDRSDINEIAKKANSAYSFIEQNADRIEQSVTAGELTQITNDLNKDIELLNKGKDRWGYEIYHELDGKLNYRVEEVPKIEAIIGMGPNMLDIIDDNEMVLISGAYGAMVRFYTSVFVDSSVEKPDKLNTTIRFFNKGALYINTVKVAQRFDNATTSPLSINLSPGWNTIEVCTFGGENAGFILDLKLSKIKQISSMNAYAIMNDYTTSKYSYSMIEQTAKDITMSVKELGDGLNDRIGELQLTVDSLTTTFVDKGYKNFIDNGDFKATDEAGNMIHPGWAPEFTSIPTSNGGWTPIDQIGTNRIIKIRKDSWTGNEPTLELSIDNLVKGCTYGAYYNISNLTLGETYTVCLELAGQRSDKTVVIADSRWNRWNTIDVEPKDGGHDLDGWEKVALTFIAKETVAKVGLFINEFKDGNGSRTAQLWAKRIGLYTGRGWRPFLQSGNEVYAGRVTINMNGVFVENSISKTYTQINSQGLNIFDVDSQRRIAYFGQDENTNTVTANIPLLYSEKIYAPNLFRKLEGSQVNYYVKNGYYGGDQSGRDINNACSSVGKALNLIKELRNGEYNPTTACFLNRSITIHLLGGSTYTEIIDIKGFYCTGGFIVTLMINNDVWINSQIHVTGNGALISIEGPSWDNPMAHPKGCIDPTNGDHAIICQNNSNQVRIFGVCLAGKWKGGKAAIYCDNTELYVQGIDISNYQIGIRGLYSSIRTHAIIGWTYYDFQLTYGSIAYASQSLPLVDAGTSTPNTTASVVYYIGNVGRINSVHNPKYIPEVTPVPPEPPAPTLQTVTRSFHPTSYSSSRKSGSSTNGEYIQGAWTGSTQFGYWTGTAPFGNAVKDFCTGAVSVTMKLYVERLNTSHGQSGGVPVIMCNEKVGLSLARGKSGWVNLSNSLVNHLKGGGSLTSHTKVINEYLRYKCNFELSVTVTKYV